MKKVVAFTIADNNNLKYYEMMKNSLRKFHSEEELPLILFGEKDIELSLDRMIYYRGTPVYMNALLNEYETVIKLDSDQIITGKLNHIWEGDFDVAVVQNSNPLEMRSYPVSVWDISPEGYVNCGFVVAKNKEFVQHWRDLCFTPHFERYQMREQDLLNILVYYGNYKVRFLDLSDKWHGLISKGYWPNIELRGDKLILPKNSSTQPTPWPFDGDKEIVCLHWAGGNNNPEKMNYRIRFKPEVSKFIDKLVK